MTKIRDDVFPKMAPFFFTKEQIISGYVDESFEALSSLFKTKEDVIQYINSLNSAETAELFLQTAKFYLIAKKYQPSSYVKLIMMISAIENLVSQDKEFQEFHIWLQGADKSIEKELGKNKLDTESFKIIIRALAEEYFKVYGSRRNVFDFFTRISKENKLKLVRSFNGFYAEYIEAFSGRLFKQVSNPRPQTISEAGRVLRKNVEKHLMPYCYDWKECWTQYGRCFPDIYCKIQQDDALLEEYLKKVVGDIYQMRNDFVHSARVTPLNKKDIVGVLGIIGPKRKPVSIELTDEDLQTIFENGFKNYFDSLKT
jgi:hypothetical protein